MSVEEFAKLKGLSEEIVKQLKDGIARASVVKGDGGVIDKRVSSRAIKESKVRYEKDVQQFEIQLRNRTRPRKGDNKS